MNVRTSMQQALQLHQQGRLPEAAQLYQAVLQREPLNATALHYLGLIACDLGNPQQGLEYVRQSVQLDSGNVNFRTNQIGLLDRYDLRAAAEDAARKLVADRPADLKLRADLARLLTKYGKHGDAAAEWEAIIAKVPNDAAVLYHSAVSYEQIGDFAKAEQRYEAALKEKPDFGEAALQLGNVYLHNAKFTECIEILRRATVLMPHHPKALTTLASILIQRGNLQESLGHLEKARALAPDDATVLHVSGYCHLSRGEVEKAIEYYERAARVDLRSLETLASVLFARLYTEAPGEQEREQHRAFQSRCSQVIKFRPQQPRQISAGERLRIGYVSPDLRNHPVGYFIEPLLANHDRTRFEIHCFSNVLVPDDLTNRLRQHVDAFHDVKIGVSTFADLDAFVRSQQIDILIDLAGHTGGNCLQLFARKPAPVQITYLGYPNTTGLEAIDFLITDSIVDPPGSSDAYYSEKLLRLPGSFGLFAPPSAAPQVAPPPHLKNGYLTFGTTARIEKWSPATLQSWSHILKAVPGSRFQIMGAGHNDPSYRDFVAAKLASYGIDPAVLNMVGTKPFLEYLAEVSKVDLLLDTNPFNGHTTTLQALYMGVPTVTLAGKLHRSRMGASIMTALGMPELIAQTPQEYEQIAISLASDPARLTDIRNSLREKLLGSSLSDGPKFARAFEELLLQAWAGRKTHQSEWEIS